MVYASVRILKFTVHNHTKDRVYLGVVQTGAVVGDPDGLVTDRLCMAIRLRVADDSIQNFVPFSLYTATPFIVPIQRFRRIS